MLDYTSEKNRRQFKRVKADILCRSAPFSLSRKPIQDIGIGGLRVFSDEKQKIGKNLEIELFPPNTKSFSCTVKVIWMNELGHKGAANYEIGLQFIKIDPADLNVLKTIVENQNEPGFENRSH